MDICRGVVATLKTFVVRTEGIAVVGVASTSIADHWQRNAAQRLNHTLISRLAQVERALSDLCEVDGDGVGLGAAVSAALLPAVASIRDQITALVVSPLVRSCRQLRYLPSLERFVRSQVTRCLPCASTVSLL